VKEKLVLVGNGMAGVRTLEEMLRSRQTDDITSSRRAVRHYTEFCFARSRGEKQIKTIMLNDATGTRRTASRCTRARRSPRSIAHEDGSRGRRYGTEIRPPAARTGF